MANKNHELWDEFEVSPISNYIKLDEPGDKIGGDILNVEKVTFKDAKGTKYVPQLTLMCDDGEERILTASNKDLLNQLIPLRPAAGDYIMVELLSKDRFSSVKRYDVTVTKPKGSSS